MIAVLGTGAMGTPIARRLLDTGHRVAVWNRTAARAAPLAAAGARVATSPADAVRGADVVITMLTDGAAVEAALFGDDGAALAVPAGSSLVEMSTVGPAAVRSIADRLPAGVDLIDAPVGGSVDAAAAGTLAIFVGGPDGAVARVMPVLEALGTVRRCGALGTGAALKVVLNAALVTGMAALADVLAVGRALGIDRAVALEALAGGALGGAVRRTAGASSFAIGLAHKDTALALATGPGPVPLVRAAEHVLRLAPDPAADLAAITMEGRPV